MLAQTIAAAGVSVFLNGQPVSSDVPPLVSAGRVLLPARAVFEALGASVQYEGSTNRITIERGTRVVRISLGSNRAIVNGRIVRLDVAPELYRGRTMIPLRFVAESLGAAVAYDDATHRVAIADTHGLHGWRSPYMIASPPPSYQSATVEYRRPAPGESVGAPLPSIAAQIETHGGPGVDFNSVRLFIDGRDVTDKMFREGDAIGYTPSVDLSAGTHEITVQGADLGGARFTANWDFQETFAYVAPANLGYQAPALYVVGPSAYVYGNTVQFVLLAPSGGSGYVNLCGSGPQYALSPALETNQYLAQFVVPPGVYAPTCYVSGYFYGPNGVPSYFLLPAPLQIDTRAPAPSPSPTLPPSHLRRPLSHPSPRPTATPTPKPRATTNPSPRPTPRVTPRPKPRSTPAG